AYRQLLTRDRLTRARADLEGERRLVDMDVVCKLSRRSARTFDLCEVVAMRFWDDLPERQLQPVAHAILQKFPSPVAVRGDSRAGATGAEAIVDLCEARKPLLKENATRGFPAGRRGEAGYAEVTTARRTTLA